MQNNNSGTNKHTTYISESTKLIQLSNQGANIQQITQILVKKQNKVKSYPQIYRNFYTKFYQQKFKKMNKITDIQINDIPESQNMAKIQVPLYHILNCTGCYQYFTKYEPIVSKHPFIIIQRSYVIEICQNKLLSQQNIYEMPQFKQLLEYFCAMANNGCGSILIAQEIQDHNTIKKGISSLSKNQILQIRDLIKQILKNIDNSQNICISFQKVDLRNSNGQVVIRILINRKINKKQHLPHHIFGISKKPYQYIPKTEKISLEYYIIKKWNYQKKLSYQQIRQQQIYQFFIKNYWTKNKNKNPIKQKYYKQNKFELNLINMIHYQRQQAKCHKLSQIYKDMFIQVNLLNYQIRDVQQKIKQAMYKVNINSHLFDIRQGFLDDWRNFHKNFGNNIYLGTIYYLRLRGECKLFCQKLKDICSKQIIKGIKIFEKKQQLLIELKY